MQIYKLEFYKLDQTLMHFAQNTMKAKEIKSIDYFGFLQNIIIIREHNSQL